MSRAIDADALQKEYMHEHDGKRLMLIDVAPTIEPRCETCEAFNKTRLLIPQPERKKGKWIEHIDDLFPAESSLECDVCHHEQPIIIDSNYCPNCGARMEGGQE
jgi:hypothetical protein